MNLLVPKIRLSAERTIFEFFLNGKQLTSEQALDLFDFASSLHHQSWGFRLVGNRVTIFIPPQTYYLEIDEFTLTFLTKDVTMMFCWLPPCVASSLVANSKNYSLIVDNKEIPVNAILNRTVRV